MNREPYPFVILRCPFQLNKTPTYLINYGGKVDIICITFYIHHWHNIMVQVKYAISFQLLWYIPKSAIIISRYTIKKKLNSLYLKNRIMKSWMRNNTNANETRNSIVFLGWNLQVRYAESIRPIFNTINQSFRSSHYGDEKSILIIKWNFKDFQFIFPYIKWIKLIKSYFINNLYNFIFFI